MELSDLQQRLEKQTRATGTDFGAIGEAARIRIAGDLAKAFSGIDVRLAPSVAETFKNLQATRIADMTAIAGVAKASEMARPVIPAPQIASALAAVDVRLAPSFAEAVAPLRTSQTFRFMPDLDIPQIRLDPAVIEAVRGFQLPHVSAALGEMRPVATAAAASYFEEAAEDAVALAEVERVAEVVDEALTPWQSYSPAKRRKVVTEIAAAITAMLLLASVLYGIRYYKAAGEVIACATVLVRAYWLLTGKLDEEGSSDS